MAEFGGIWQIFRGIWRNLAEKCGGIWRKVRGEVWGGTFLCSTSTGEYCGINTGVAIGTLQLSSLIYVDDMIDLSGNCTTYVSSHDNAMTFSHSKKLTYSGTKCYSMTINGKKETPPELIIDPSKDTKVVRTNEIIYLGDIFNEKGDNDGLIKDRISRGVKAIISITSILICHSTVVYF